MEGEEVVASSTAVGQNEYTTLNPRLHIVSGECAVLILAVESNVGCVLVEVRCENPSRLISQSGFLLHSCSASLVDLFIEID